MCARTTGSPRPVQARRPTISAATLLAAYGVTGWKGSSSLIAILYRHLTEEGDEVVTSQGPTNPLLPVTGARTTGMLRQGCYRRAGELHALLAC
jgi:hypothetical protein